MRYLHVMPPTTREFIATRIRMLLAQRNRPQAWLAEQLGWRPIRLSQRMTCSRPFDTDEIDQVAHAFGLTATELLAENFPVVVAS